MFASFVIKSPLTVYVFSTPPFAKFKLIARLLDDEAAKLANSSLNTPVELFQSESPESIAINAVGLCDVIL